MLVSNPTGDAQAATDGAVLRSALDAIILMNSEGVVVEYNPAAERMFGYSRAEAANRPLADLIIPPKLRERHASGLRRYLATGEASILGRRLELRAIRKGGEEFPVELTIAMVPVDGKPPMFAGYVRDLSEREREAALSSGQSRVLEMIAAGAEFHATLDMLVRVIENDSPQLLGSILLLDDDGAHLRHGAAPSLPAEYTQAIDGGAIGARAGSCGTAAFRRAQVIVEDIQIDPLWADYRALAAVHRLRACWSTPIFDSQRRVLGTFALYFRNPGQPTARHMRLIEMATHTAAIAIARMKSERERTGLMQDLGVRVRELSTLHEAARILQSERAVDETVLGELAALLPLGWQFPEICEARVAFGRMDAKTPGWRASPWIQSERFATGEGQSGVIEIVYLEEPPAVATPFLAEESSLLRSVADMLVAQLERKRAQDALHTRETMFRSIFENAAIGMTLTDMHSRFVKCNPVFCRMLGYREEEVVGRTFADFTHPDDIGANTESYRSLVAGEIDHFRLDKRYLCKDGRIVWVQLTVSLIPGNRGAERFTIGMMEDITSRKQAEARVEYLATHDDLTDLPNRNLMRDRIEQAIARARRSQMEIALLYLDLDRFKVVNDGFGHPFGDTVLKAAGDRLRAVVRETDTVARQSGDEFLILLADLRRPSDVFMVAQKALQALAAPFLLEGREIYVSASIGVSVFPQDGQDAETLIANADVAMYRAKDLGRNTCQFFTREMSERVLRRVDLENRLRLAISQNQLRLDYQPKVDLASGRITGCEALVRWTHPELGAVSPGQFIPVAEESALIVPIGDWVLRTACAQGKAWLDAGLPPIAVSVNLSARQFLQQDVVSWVLEALRETALSPGQLELELTESLIAQDTEKVIATVNQLKASGVHLSIDDFGTGYSSLSYLKRFRVDTLKIDQSFVRHMLKEPGDAAIVRAVISLAHSLKMKVIAEGVETAEHCAFLRQHGCDEIQGYYFSKPVPAEQFAQLLGNGKQLAA